MFSWGFRKKIKEQLQRILAGISPHRGLSRFFPFIGPWLDWVLYPPKAPKNAVAEIKTGSMNFGLYLLENDPTISPVLFARHIWEKNVTYFFERAVRPGDGVVDLGAHFGYYSILAGKKAGPGGRVFAIEGLAVFLEKPDVVLFSELNYRRIREAGSSPEAYLQRIQDFGFKIFVIDPNQSDPEVALWEADLARLATGEQHIDLYCVKG